MAFVQRSLREDGFGAALRELRELRGYSREALAELTKIHSSIILALEEEHLDDLKDPVYTERHIRSLVLTLQGRPSYFVQKYHELLKGKYTPDPLAYVVRPGVRRRDFFVTTRVVGAAGFMALVLLAGLYVYWQMRLIRVPPRLIVNQPVNGALVHEPHILVQGETEAAAFVTVNGQTAVVDSDGQFRASFEIPRGTTMLTIEARKRYGAIVQVIRRVSYIASSTVPFPDDEPSLDALLNSAASSTALASSTAATIATSTASTSVQKFLP